MFVIRVQMGMFGSEEEELQDVVNVPTFRKDGNSLPSHKSLTLVSVLCQMDPIHQPILILILILISHLHINFQSCRFPFMFSTSSSFS
jgi:hypothetical protein